MEMSVDDVRTSGNIIMTMMMMMIMMVVVMMMVIKFGQHFSSLCDIYCQSAKKTDEWNLKKAGVKEELSDSVKARKLAHDGHTMIKLGRKR